MRTAKQMVWIFMVVIGGWSAAHGQIVAAATGTWNAPATWVGGVVPGAADDVVVDAGITVTINIPGAACKNLTANGYVFFDAATTNNGLVVNGSISVGPSGRLRSGGASPTAARVQHLTLYKDLTVALGGSFDMRVGSGSAVTVGRLTFAGNTNSVINMSLTAYGSSVEEFNSVIINKSEGAKVIVASGNVFQNNNSTNSADTLVLINGIIETQGTSVWGHLATSSAAVQGASAASYVKGVLGRGISNSGTPPITRVFDVGDADGYRPITIRTQSVGSSTGHYVAVQVVNGDANTGSSTFAGGIDKVSGVRYHKVTYFPGPGAPTMTLDRFAPGYQAVDGVGANNTDLRVAFSINERALWTGMGQTVADTTFVTDNVITPDSLSLPEQIILTSTSTAYVALARAAGTTTNSLVKAGVGVNEESAQPRAFVLGQNFPNPFNPSTNVEIMNHKSQLLTLSVCDLLGREVALLLNEERPAGRFTVTFDASHLTSGVYLYSLRAGGSVETKRMLLMK